MAACRPPCFECGAPSHHDHHVIPRSLGGTRTVPLCLACHGKVHDRTMTAAELTRSALAAKRRRGERTGTVPFGASLAADGRTLIPHEAERVAVARMYAMKAAGRSLRQIAGELDRSGVPTKGGRPWSAAAVARILGRSA